MKRAEPGKATQIVKGNIFDALGFSPAEDAGLKVKAEILSALLEHIGERGYTQKQLITLLDEYQPSVSNLLHGRIGQVSIEKLLRYADRLGLETSVSIRPVAGSARLATRKPAVEATGRALKSAM